MIASGTVTSAGKAGDTIGLAISWDNIYGYVFDYQDTANNPYWWTVVTVYPTGNYSTMKFNDLDLGNLYTSVNSPVYYSYFDQIGFTMSSVPANSGWNIQASNSKYIPAGGSGYTFLDHAWTMDWYHPSGHSQIIYASYWKEFWSVSATSAQGQGVSVSGSGSSSSNVINADYSGSQQAGGVTLW